MTATINWAGSVTGVVAPVISLLILILVRSISSKLSHRSDSLEKAISDTEGELIGEIRNGVTTKLNQLLDGQLKIHRRVEKLEEKVNK